MKELSVYQADIFSNIKELVKNAGYKMTNQRSEILKEFIKEEGDHLSADDIHNILHGKGFGISTIYRSINLFVNLGILTEFKIDNKSLYELKIFAKKPLHIHFKCTDCGDLRDIVDREIILKHLRMNNLIEEKYSTLITDSDIIYHGLCGKCVER